MNKQEAEFFTTKSDLIQGNESEKIKKKLLRACVSCRKKKVRCDGCFPCECCTKADIDCEFEDSYKKEPGMKRISSTQKAKLKHLRNVLVQLSTVIEHTKPNAPLYSNPTPVEHVQLKVKEAGQASYIPDNSLRIDRLPQTIENWETYMKEIIEPPQIYDTIEPIIHTHLLNIYFQYIDPLLPILHKPSFYFQLQEDQQKISPILLNAMYCVSSRWDVSIPARQDEPRGWNFYLCAVELLDKENKPRLSTVQALLLLLKYNEHVRRPGFLSRTRYYFQMIVRMSKDLGLQRNIEMETAIMMMMMTTEIEKRKRTFWAVYCYDVMMSIENGTPFHFDLEEIHVEDPQLLLDESYEQDKLVHFVLLIHIMRCQSRITRFLRQKLDTTCAVSNFLIDWKESAAFDELTLVLKSSIGMVTALRSFPQEDDMCYTVCFLYLACCFATISLHRPFAFQETLQSSPHTGHCAEAAYNIRKIIGLIFQCDAFEDMYCSFRGIHQILHYLSAAITVFKEAGYTSEMNDLMQIAHYLASTSPVTEMIK